MTCKTDNFDISPEYLAECDRQYDLGFECGLVQEKPAAPRFGMYRKMYFTGWKNGKALAESLQTAGRDRASI